MSFSRNHHSVKVLSFFVCFSALTLLSVGCGAGVAEAASPESSPPSAVPSASEITGANLVAGPIAFPEGFMKSVKDYGAVGDGTTDDTAALQAALNDGRSDPDAEYNGVPKGLYFPPGIYIVHSTLAWNGCCVVLQGAGSSTSTIRLIPSAPGFDNPSAPKPILQPPAGISSFRQNIWDLGFHVGAGNPGAVGIDYVSNNTGSIRNVLVYSEDGTGVAGVMLTRHYPGPLLIKDFEVTGFQYGIITAAYEYGQTLEGITLLNQSVTGIYNQQQTLSVRNLLSYSHAPAVTNNGGMLLLLDAELLGNESNTNAVVNQGNLYARNVQSSGYAATLLDSTGTTPKTVSGTLTEYLAGTPQTLHGGTNATSLNLPISDTPTYVDADLAAWGKFVPAFYGDTKTLQALLNSGASTIYFPFGAYFSFNETVITVPDTVRRIVGFSSVVNGHPDGINGGGIRFVVNSNNPNPLIVEQFGYGLKVDQYGSRPVVLKSGSYSYTSYTNTGDLFLEDIFSNKQLVIQQGQKVWARQLDTELAGTKIINNGSLWVLGIKTENDGTVISTSATGETEVLGNLIYPAHPVSANSSAFRSSTQAVSYIYTQSSYCSDCGYPTQVTEVVDGATAKITSNPGIRYVMPLYHGR